MVYASLQQPRDSYRLWHIFSYPGNHGSTTAVAVPANWRDHLTSLYTVLLGMIFAYAWKTILAVLRQRKERNQQNRPSPLLLELYDEKEFTSFLGWLWKRRSDKELMRKKLTLACWLLGAIVALCLIPTAFVPYISGFLVLGTGAPANPNEIYFPKLYDYIDVDAQPKTTNIFKESILRGLGVQQLRDPNIVNKVQFSNQTLYTRNDGQNVLQFGYRYNITAQDWGMQRFSGLSLVVEGSCYTEYGWIVHDSNPDTYNLWNDPTKNVTVTAADVAVPRAWFVYKGSTEIGSPNLVTNHTYAIWVSTAGRWSFTPGIDPWYLTTLVSNSSNSTRGGTTWDYQIRTHRPVLSCWETNAFAYKGDVIGDIWYFVYNRPDLKFPEAVRNIIYGLLWEPAVIATGNNLDTINLQSSEQDIEYSYSAASASIAQDLQRMLVTTYVWVSNILLDTTLINPAQAGSLPNFITSDNQSQVADFVVPTPNAASLSLSYVIVIPLLAAITWLIKHFATSGLDEESKEGGATVQLFRADAKE